MEFVKKLFTKTKLHCAPVFISISSDLSKFAIIKKRDEAFSRLQFANRKKTFHIPDGKLVKNSAYVGAKWLFDDNTVVIFETNLYVGASWCFLYSLWG